MILNAIAAKLKHRSKADFKGRHHEAALIVQAVSWYLRCPLSYRDIDAGKRFFRKMLKDAPLAFTGPHRHGWGGPYPPTIAAARKDGRLARNPIHYVTKHLQQRIESDHSRGKTNMPRIGGFQSFGTARRTIKGFEAMLWLRKGFGLAGTWKVLEQNRLLAALPQIGPKRTASTHRRARHAFCAG